MKLNLLLKLYQELRAAGIARAKILRLIRRILSSVLPKFPIFLAIGLPAVGKGTVLECYKNIAGSIPVKSFSELLKAYANSGAVFAQQAKDAMKEGKRVPDYIVLEVLLDAIQNASSSFVLDGVPRSLAQAITLLLAGANIKLLWFKCPEHIVISRAINRRVCGNCKFVTSVQDSPDGICPVCGGTLSARTDDQHIKERCADFKATGLPAVEFLKNHGCPVLMIYTKDIKPKDNARNIDAFVAPFVMRGI